MALSGSEGWFTFDEGYSKKLSQEEKKHTTELDILNALWVFLPAEINNKIIKKVPLEDLWRWRPVCKNWNRLIISGMHCSTEFTNNIPLIVRSDIFSLGSLSTYSEKVGNWCSTDLTFLLPVLSFRERTLIECRYITGGRLGLLFMLCTFRVNVNVESWVIVCNPLTKKSTRVRLPDERRGGHVWVICDDHQQHYNFLVTYKDESLHRVYDSRSGSWKQVTGPLVDPFCIFSAVSNQGCLYFLKRPRHLEMHKHPTVGAYDPSSNTWSEIQGVPNHIGPDRPRLVETGGQLLYVARTFISENKLGRLSWCFYKMEGSEAGSFIRSKHVEWVRVRVMPCDIYWKLNLTVMSAPIYREIRCIGEGNNIFFVGVECTCKQEGEKRVTNRGVKLFVAVHNFQQNTWTWLPAFTDSEARFWHWETNSLRLLSFQPSLAAVG